MCVAGRGACYRPRRSPFGEDRARRLMSSGRMNILPPFFLQFAATASCTRRTDRSRSVMTTCVIYIVVPAGNTRAKARVNNTIPWHPYGARRRKEPDHAFRPVNFKLGLTFKSRARSQPVAYEGRLRAYLRSPRDQSHGNTYSSHAAFELFNALANFPYVV